MDAILKLHKARILIVDDQVANIRLLDGILRRAGYTELTSTTNSREVVSIFATMSPDLLLLDLMMPHMDGFEIMAHLAAIIPEEDYFPILVLTADATSQIMRRALQVGAKDFLTKPFDAMEVLLRIDNLLKTRMLHLQLREQNHTLDEKVQERTLRLAEAQIEILERLAAAADFRDDATGKHTRRVGQISALIAQALDLPSDTVELIRQTAPLHDVGKIGLPDSILLKPGKLTVEEFEIMKTHTIIGSNMLKNGQSELTQMAETIALTHHERWDGTGYPGNLVADMIPLVGRIVTVADVYDALTHVRPYKEAWPVKEAVAEIERQRAWQFDPQVVDAFMSLDMAREHTV